MILQLKNLLVDLGRVSDWIDEKFFPVDDRPHAHKLLHEHQERVEKAGKVMNGIIDNCRSLEASYRAMDMIANFRKLYGNTTQVTGWMDSLHLKLYNQQRVILENIQRK
jgi:hypothetical protein